MDGQIEVTEEKAGTCVEGLAGRGAVVAEKGVVLLTEPGSKPGQPRQGGCSPRPGCRSLLPTWQQVRPAGSNSKQKKSVAWKRAMARGVRGNSRSLQQRKREMNSLQREIHQRTSHTVHLVWSQLYSGSCGGVLYPCSFRGSHLLTWPLHFHGSQSHPNHSGEKPENRQREGPHIWAWPFTRCQAFEENQWHGLRRNIKNTKKKKRRKEGRRRKTLVLEKTEMLSDTENSLKIQIRMSQFWEFCSHNKNMEKVAMTE